MTESLAKTAQAESPAKQALSYAANDPMSPRWMQIERIIEENYNTFTWSLRFPDDAPFVFSPGQFTMLYLFGVGEIPISISGAAHEAHRLIHTIRRVGVVTKAMQEVKEGAWIGVRGPYGTAWPLEKARGKDVLLVAGGIGLAPLRPVMYALLHEREAYGKIILVLGARQPRDILFLQELQAWGSRLDVTVEATVDLGLDGWKGHVGLITKLLPRLPYEPSQTVAMICGPERMMRFSADILIEQGVSADAIAVSMERDMKCAVGWCGHCQLAGHLVCKDGPVYPYPLMRRWLIEEEM